VSEPRTVSEIFSVKEWRDLESWVRSCSKSLKIAPFNRLQLDNMATLKSKIEATQTHWNWYHSGVDFCLPSIVTMALSSISSEIKPDIGQKSRFFSYCLAFDAPIRGPRQNIAIPFCTEKTERCGYPRNLVTLKSRLRVTQDHWKRNHWIYHTRLTISRVIWRWVLSWSWNAG